MSRKDKIERKNAEDYFDLRISKSDREYIKKSLEGTPYSDILTVLDDVLLNDLMLKKDSISDEEEDFIKDLLEAA